MMMDRNRYEVFSYLNANTERSRRIGGIHPDRISLMWNVQTPNLGSVSNKTVSQPRGRPKGSPAGMGGIDKRMPTAKRQGETITRWIGQCPTRKGAHAILVNYPKDAVRVANQGES